MTPDFNVITTRILTGAAPPDEGFIEALWEAGVTHVLDVTDEHDDTSLLAQSGKPWHYLYNPTADDSQPKDVSWFRASLMFALPMFAQTDTKLYTHCTAGMNRGPSSAFVVMRALGWTSDDAFALLKAKRPQVVVRYRDDADKAIVALGYG